MRLAMIVTAALLLGGCPYRTRIYTGDTAGMAVKADGTFQLGEERKITNAQKRSVDLATLAQECESGVIAYIDEVRTFRGFNIFLGSRRGIEILCALKQ